MNTIQTRLAALSRERLLGIVRGVEKESLRSTSEGSLALTPHPKALGSALTHPHITTDYSESQLELVTGVHASPESCLQELVELHQYTYRALGEEMLWVSSMPCNLPTDETIPIGRYGSSNVGRAKSVYRIGLGYRYGRRMQTISGIHYNWSLPGVTSEDYFGLIRNFRRHAFLLLYLLGASPAVCASFVAGRQHGLETLSKGTLYMPYGTSLRMGRLGYQSEAQSSLCVSYNGLEGYAASIHEALTRPYPPYEAIGVMNPGGEYNQLATTLLQIENEFYGTIRPKRVIRSGERPLHALRERGVEYVEVRLLDLNPFLGVGIDAQTMRLLDVFLLHCLLSDSPPDSPEEIAALGRNQHRTAAFGREPGLALERDGQSVGLRAWGEELLRDCQPIALALDGAHGGEAHQSALAAAMDLMSQPEALPSSRVLASIRGSHADSYTAFVRERSRQTRLDVLARDYAPEVHGRLSQAAVQSVRDQLAMEAADSMSFEQFRQHYISPERLELGAHAVSSELQSL